MPTASICGGRASAWSAISWTDWHYAFVYDFGNTSDSNNPNNALANANSSTSPTTTNNFLAGVENAVITYNGFYKHGAQFPVAFDFGVQDVPWTLDEATSSNDTMFMERSSAQVVATEFGGGDFRRRSTCARTMTAIGWAPL